MSVKNKVFKNTFAYLVSRPLLAVLTLFFFCFAAPASATDPAFDVPTAQLAAAMDCTPFTHPDKPVVLMVHGYTSSYEHSYKTLYAKVFISEGYDVCGINLPDFALYDMQVSAEYVAYAIQSVYAATGKKVDVIGHSEGVLVTRWALKWWGSVQTMVDDAILLAGPNNGLAATAVCSTFPLCPAAALQFTENSHFMTALNAGNVTPGGISYTSVYSTTDELVPSSSAPLGGTASNIAVQDICPLPLLSLPVRVVTHIGMLDDSVAWALILDAITHDGPAVASRVSSSVCNSLYAPGLTALDAGNAEAGAVADFTLHAGGATTTTTEPPLQPYAQ